MTYYKDEAQRLCEKLDYVRSRSDERERATSGAAAKIELVLAHARERVPIRGRHATKQFRKINTLREKETEK